MDKNNEKKHIYVWIESEDKDGCTYRFDLGGNPSGKEIVDMIANMIIAVAQNIFETNPVKLIVDIGKDIVDWENRTIRKVDKNE